MRQTVALGGEPLELDDGVLDPYREKLTNSAPAPPVRLVYAAAHLVLEESYNSVDHRFDQPLPPAEITREIDWENTFALRRRLDDLGFGIAEAMDTAQRFLIGWENASRLIEGCGALNLKHGFVAGAGVDHLAGVEDEDQLVEGVVFQARAIQAAGGIPILLPLLWLCEQAYDEDGYVRVYGRIAESLDGPLFVHWLGEMFLPALAGYFPGASFRRILAAHPETLRGAKLSLLDADLELQLRADLATRGQIMLTGDDFNFAQLMTGGEVTGETAIGPRRIPTGEFSHGLLGIFDGIAEPASLALQFLARGDELNYMELMSPCETLSRHLFAAPTQHYKAGLAFLAWLNGLQPNPMLVGHEECARSVEHYLEAARLASAAGVIKNAEIAADRLRTFFEAR
ncbi:MAG: DUF993 family protein [bacterium]